MVPLLASLATAASAPRVGAAFSGGGLTAFIETVCTLEALAQSPDAARWTSNDWTAAVNSGGTLGYILAQSLSAEALVYPPFYTMNSLTYDALSQKYEGNASQKWFAEVLDVVPSITARRTEAAWWEQLGKSNGAGWWETALETALLAYGLKGDQVRGGARPVVAGLSVLRASSAPIQRRNSGPNIGTMRYALGSGGRANLLPGEYDFASGLVSVRGNSSSAWATTLPFSAIAGGSFSSAFWGVSIVEMSKIEYALSKGFLIDLPAGAGGDAFYALDGGMVDTTGIAVQLRRKVDRLVVFLGQNNDLTTASNATLAYLFGVETATDAQNTLEGPGLAQVFPSALYAEVIANLTNARGTATFSATLRNVSVVANAYLGVEAYTLESVTIVGNQPLAAFFDSFADDEVKAHVDPKFPNNFPVGMSTFDANLMCLWSAYRVEKLAPVLSAVWL